MHDADAVAKLCTSDAGNLKLWPVVRPTKTFDIMPIKKKKIVLDEMLVPLDVTTFDDEYVGPDPYAFYSCAMTEIQQRRQEVKQEQEHDDDADDDDDDDDDKVSSEDEDKPKRRRKARWTKKRQITPIIPDMTLTEFVQEYIGPIEHERHEVWHVKLCIITLGT